MIKTFKLAIGILFLSVFVSTFGFFFLMFAPLVIGCVVLAAILSTIPRN